MFDKLRDELGLRPGPAEDDVAGDDHLAQSRDTGGSHRDTGDTDTGDTDTGDTDTGDTDTGDTGDTGDAAATTGTGASEEFVGRVAGQDDGGADRTSGAEARAFEAQDDR